MNFVSVWVDSRNEPFTFEMDDKQIALFLGFTNDQDVTDVFEHEQNGINYRIFKKHISFVSYRKCGE